MGAKTLFSHPPRMQAKVFTFPSSWSSKSVRLPNLESPDVHFRAHARDSKVSSMACVRAGVPAPQRVARVWDVSEPRPPSERPGRVWRRLRNAEIPRIQGSAPSLACRYGDAQKPRHRLSVRREQSRESSAREPGWETTWCQGQVSRWRRCAACVQHSFLLPGKIRKSCHAL